MKGLVSSKDLEAFLNPKEALIPRISSIGSVTLLEGTRYSAVAALRKQLSKERSPFKLLTSPGVRHREQDLASARSEIESVASRLNTAAIEEQARELFSKRFL
jgi:hypothetical protein